MPSPPSCSRSGAASSLCRAAVASSRSSSAAPPATPARSRRASSSFAPGHARVGLRDRPAVRNHLRSVHAVALMNLAEVASGLATISSLPPGARGILAGLSIEYLKKARGPLEAVCDATIDYAGERREVPVDAVIRDAAGDVVARATARWLIGPETPKGAAKP